MLKGNSSKSLDQFRETACPRSAHLNATLVQESGFGNSIEEICVFPSLPLWQQYCTFSAPYQGNWERNIPYFLEECNFQLLLFFFHYRVESFGLRYII